MAVMHASPTILFLIPYFGSWPWWMPFFLMSCRANPSIDWLLIGDCGELAELPPNVRQQHISFADYCALVSRRLGLHFEPRSPYKLCDLKPAYGYIHEDEVRGYDFWGFSDLDVVYGDLRGYFCNQRLQRYKLLSTHARRVSGHLCLLRNEPALRELFWQIPQFRQRISDQKHHALDEGGFSRLFLWRKNLPEPLFRLVNRFNGWHREAEFTEAWSTPSTSKPWTDGSRQLPASWSWEQGRLMSDRDGTRSFPYLHFLNWKKHDWKALVPAPAAELQALAASGRWRIDATGFHPLGAAG